MAFEDLYEVTLTQTFQGQIISNVFHLYQELAFVPLLTSASAVLATNFVAQFLPLISSWQNSEIVTTSVRARNLFDGADDFLISLAIPGSDGAATQTLPTFTAVGFKLDGDNALVKSGSKRFAGMNETVQDDGVLTNSTFLSQMTDIADALEGYITVGVIIQDNVFKFVVIKRVRTGTPGNYTYRLPETSAEAVFSNIVVSAFSALITSQVSRKIGVGS